MRRVRNALFGLLLGTSLTACSPFIDGGSKISCPDGPYAEGELAELMRHIEAIRILSPNAQEREYRRVEERFASGEAMTDRFRLALLLSMPETVFRNDARARALLQHVDRSHNDGVYWHVAQFLLRGLNERRAMDQALEAERKQTQQLRKQLQELKAIEQHMDQRDQVEEQRGSP